jgi:ketosteroid isomerase-like protein
MRFHPLAALCAGVVLAAAWTGSSAATAAANERIEQTIKADVAEMVAGINAHDVARATQFDAVGIVTMESGRTPSTGADADRQGMAMAMQHTPSWRLTMLDETVDVASAGDMAIYRGTYNEDSNDNGVALTHVVNFIADFQKQRDGSWKIEWSVVCAQSRSHPANSPPPSAH